MRVLKGAEVSVKMKEEVQAALAKCKGESPKLAIIRVGENPDDMSYERGATKKMESFGLRVQSYVYPEDITDSDFKAEFTRINEDPDVTGILMLRPLPKQICEKDIEGMIDPEKDLDGISPVNIAKVFAGDDSGKCDRYHLPHQNQRPGRHLPQCGNPCGCSRTGKNAEWRLCRSGGSGD